MSAGRVGAGKGHGHFAYAFMSRVCPRLSVRLSVCLSMGSVSLQNSRGNHKALAPYSISPSPIFYNFLYLPLLNLQEKMDSEKKGWFY